MRRGRVSVQGGAQIRSDWALMRLLLGARALAFGLVCARRGVVTVFQFRVGLKFVMIGL